MLARIATTLRNQQIHGDGEGATLVVNPDCAVSSSARYMGLTILSNSVL